MARASAVLYGTDDHITYDNQYYRNPVHYRHPDSVATGVYMMPLALGEYDEISDITSTIYQKLQSSGLSIDDVIKVREIIKEVQIGKLYQLIEGISREYAMPIVNTGVLRALLNYLARTIRLKIYILPSE